MTTAPSAKLDALGFDDHLRRQFDPDTKPDAIPGRVARVDGRVCTVLTADGERRVRIAKRIARQTPIAVGDWLVLGTDGAPERVLERRTQLSRRGAGRAGRRQILAANLDTVMVTCGLDRDFNVRRIERWLGLVHAGGARPVVLLTKAGLVDLDARRRRIDETRAVALEAPVVAVDVLADIGLDALERALALGRTTAFVGSSGVGKSTLVNYLRGDTTMATAPVSAAHGKGRHTTTHRELHRLPGRDNLVIDTPGLREVGLWDEGGLEATFADVLQLARDCRFSDCAHASEPGCAVKAALERGDLDPARLESHRRLEHERASTARRADEHARRAHERRFSREVRRISKAKRRD